MSNILVVEDEANVRKLVTVNLIRRGYTVFEAQDVQHALARLQTQAFDLIVLDIKLPDLTGWDLLAKIAADSTLDFDGPVLVMTSFDYGCTNRSGSIPDGRGSVGEAVQRG